MEVRELIYYLYFAFTEPWIIIATLQLDRQPQLGLLPTSHEQQGHSDHGDGGGSGVHRALPPSDIESGGGALVVPAQDDDDAGLRLPLRLPGCPVRVRLPLPGAVFPARFGTGPGDDSVAVFPLRRRGFALSLLAGGHALPRVVPRTVEAALHRQPRVVLAAGIALRGKIHPEVGSGSLLQFYVFYPVHKRRTMILVYRTFKALLSGSTFRSATRRCRPCR